MTVTTDPAPITLRQNSYAIVRGLFDPATFKRAPGGWVVTSGPGGSLLFSGAD